MVQNRIGSRVKAENDLGFKYQYTLEEGLKKLIEWRIKTGVDSI
jgi:UDP-glucose 4-epimerase